MTLRTTGLLAVTWASSWLAETELATGASLLRLTRPGSCSIPPRRCRCRDVASVGNRAGAAVSAWPAVEDFARAAPTDAPGGDGDGVDGAAPRPAR